MRHLTRILSIILLFFLAESLALHYQPIVKTRKILVFDRLNITDPFQVLITNQNATELFQIITKDDINRANNFALPFKVSAADSDRLNISYQVQTDVNGNQLVTLTARGFSTRFHYSITRNQITPLFQETYSANHTLAFLTLLIFVVLLIYCGIAIWTEKRYSNTK